MTMTEQQATNLLRQDLLDLFRVEHERAEEIDRWVRWDHDSPHAPQRSTKEYQELAKRATTPYLRLVVSSTVRGLYVDGYRQADAPAESSAWEWWQRNAMDRRQVPLHRAAVTYGLAYATVLPGVDTFGEPMPLVRPSSPKRMMAFYDDPADDDWARYAIRVDPIRVGGQRKQRIRLYDDAAIYEFELVPAQGADGPQLTFMGAKDHGIGVCPVVRFANEMDTEGRCTGEVEPFISVQGRIDQTTFDRLVVQRFASWVVRTIAGMSINETTAATGESPAEARLRLRAEDILVAEAPDAKFGSLPATPLNGFTDAKTTDVQDLSAVSSTPAHELLGVIANLSAEALMAAELSHERKIGETRMSLGHPHEQTLRLAARVSGDVEAAKDMSSQVRWRDTSGQAFAAIVDGLVKLDTIGVPRELLWEKIPEWTQQDVERAKELAAQGGLSQLLEQIANANTPTIPAGV